MWSFREQERRIGGHEGGQQELREVAYALRYVKQAFGEVWDIKLF